MCNETTQIEEIKIILFSSLFAVADIFQIIIIVCVVIVLYKNVWKKNAAVCAQLVFSSNKTIKNCCNDVHNIFL